MREAKDIQVLVVDDEAELRETIAFDFRRKGYQVREAADGEAALALFVERRADVIISDVRMPGGDGVTLLRRIKALDATVPVVMFVTGAGDLSLEDAYDLGADAVFSKPFDRKALLAAVTKTTQSIGDRWEQRRPERHEVRFGVRLRLAGLEQAVTARVLNLGRGGFFVELDGRCPEVGSPISFEIALDSGTPSVIAGQGTIRWVRASADPKICGCGVEFDFLEADSRSQIISFINALKTQAFIPKTGPR